MEELSRVKLSRVKDFIAKVEENIDAEDIEIGMEYFISAFFPDAYDNLKMQMTQAYIQGYKDGAEGREI